jgi:hypothetical protein
LSHPRKLRAALVATLTIALVAAFAAFGGGTIAQSAISAAQYQYGKQKVAICHKGKKTIRVAQPALAAHLRHGDRVGTCASLAQKVKKAKKAKAAKAKAEQAKAADEQKSSGSKGNGKGK